MNSGSSATRRASVDQLTDQLVEVADLAGGHADRTWAQRLRRWALPEVVILDDFAMRDFTTTQADDLYELITERATKSLIITANRTAAKAHSSGERVQGAA